MGLADGPIEDSVPLDSEYPSVTERYFTKFYFIPKEKNKVEIDSDAKHNAEGLVAEGSNQEEKESKEDVVMNPSKNTREEKPGSHTSPSSDSSGHVCVMAHSNKLCIVTLASRHPVLAQKKTITKVNYDVGKFNRLENQVSGKGKRGAQMLGPRSPICIITCSDGTSYTVLAAVNGKLVEVNERLVDHPELLSEKPDAEGYLAVVLPPLRSDETLKSKLLTQDEYDMLDQ